MTTLQKILEQGPVEASAPCRIDMGGTLDLSSFFLPLRHFQPCTFNAALAMRTRVRLSSFDTGKLKVVSRGFEDVVMDSQTASYDNPVGLMLAVAAFFNADGVLIEIDSASPPRSALGGSSVAAVALIWAFAKALARTGRPMPERKHAAILAHAIEQGAAGINCGMQDQLAAAFGGINCWNWIAEPGAIPFERRIMKPSGGTDCFSKQLLVAYCGQPHESRNINSIWVKEFVGGGTRSIWHEIIACSRRFVEALDAGDHDSARAAMNREVDLRCQLTPDVLDEVGRLLVIAARSHDCAARFTGAGGGVCVWAMGSAERISQLKPIWQEVLAAHEQACLLDGTIDEEGVL